MAGTYLTNAEAAVKTAQANLESVRGRLRAQRSELAGLKAQVDQAEQYQLIAPIDLSTDSTPYPQVGSYAASYITINGQEIKLWHETGEFGLWHVDSATPDAVTLSLTIQGGPDDAPAPDRLAIVERGAVAVTDGRVSFVGATDDCPEATETIDAGGRALLPGLVDPHTHLVFAGSRVDELARRMSGVDYRTIAALESTIWTSILRPVKRSLVMKALGRSIVKALPLGA